VCDHETSRYEEAIAALGCSARKINIHNMYLIYNEAVSRIVQPGELRFRYKMIYTIYMKPLWARKKSGFELDSVVTGTNLPAKLAQKAHRPCSSPSRRRKILHNRTALFWAIMLRLVE
jgi:hypothetical protein